jgi:hypothetical protein
MANITITLTAEQVDALYRATGTLDNGYQDNMTVDAEMGDTVWADTHAGLDEIREKLDDQQWIEEWVAEGFAARPDLSKTVIRKYAKKALQAEKEGSE